MKILVAGPDNGMEFGWFLMRWQAKIRFLSRQYEKTYVITSSERLAVYRDFARHFIFMQDDLKADMWRFRGCDIDYIQPSKQFCCSTGNDEFIKLGKENSVAKTVVIHARKKKDGREWDEKKWNEFLKSLHEITNYPIVSIGSHKATFDLNTIDRKDNAFEAMDFLANAALCIGPSSGPMHLASLCGCPLLVWSDDRVWNLGVKKGTNRERYETVWNPFNTPVQVIDDYGWNPPVQIILGETEKWLKDK